jgi:GH15 family glucan-1,4-alpha-glucosidase
VAKDGTIDWLCVPRFDSASVFCALLDSERGGGWRLSPAGEVPGTQQFYFPDSNVLITRFLTEDGVVEVFDFMLRSEAHVRFGYGQRDATPKVQDAGSVLLADGDVALRLRATVPLTVTGAQAGRT